MGRTVLFSLLMGLAVGLWLGFNPSTHRSLLRWWDREMAAQVSGKPHAAAAIRELDSRLARSLQAPPRPPARRSGQPETVPTANQIGAELHAFWLALQRIWLNFWRKLGV
jgi:hypothetical protein